MKKTLKLIMISSVLAICLTVFALFFLLSTSPVQMSTFCENQCAKLSLQTAKTKPVISSSYENGVCEFVYNGLPHNLDVSISSDQELIFYRVLGQNEIEVVNEFVNVGEYIIKVVANENETYSEPDALDLTVRVLPSSLSSKLNNSIKEISIMNDDGFSLNNSYSANDISRGQKRAAKKAAKQKLTYEEKIIAVAGVAPKIDSQNYEMMSILLELPDNFSMSKNYRFFEYKSNGELKELSYVVDRDGFLLSDISTDSIIVVSCNKINPYLWIWLLLSGLSFVGIVLLLYFFTPRKISFYLEDSRIYVVKVGRRQEITLSDGLENYEWFLDKNLTNKAESFGVKETSKKYYAKIKR